MLWYGWRGAEAEGLQKLVEEHDPSHVWRPAKAHSGAHRLRRGLHGLEATRWTEADAVPR